MPIEYWIGKAKNQHTARERESERAKNKQNTQIKKLCVFLLHLSRFI